KNKERFAQKCGRKIRLRGVNRNQESRREPYRVSKQCLARQKRQARDEREQKNVREFRKRKGPAAHRIQQREKCGLPRRHTDGGNTALIAKHTRFQPIGGSGVIKDIVGTFTWKGAQ